MNWSLTNPGLAIRMHLTTGRKTQRTNQTQNLSWLFWNSKQSEDGVAAIINRCGAIKTHDSKCDGNKLKKKGEESKTKQEHALQPVCARVHPHSSPTVKIDVTENCLHHSLIEPLQCLHTQTQTYHMTSNSTWTDKRTWIIFIFKHHIDFSLQSILHSFISLFNLTTFSCWVQLPLLLRGMVTSTFARSRVMAGVTSTRLARPSCITTAATSAFWLGSHACSKGRTNRWYMDHIKWWAATNVLP